MLNKDLYAKTRDLLTEIIQFLAVNDSFYRELTGAERNEWIESNAESISGRTGKYVAAKNITDQLLSAAGHASYNQEHEAETDAMNLFGRFAELLVELV